MTIKPWRSFPNIFIQRIKLMYTPRVAESILSTLCLPHPTTFRVNTLKTTPEEVEARLNDEGVHFRKAGLLDNAYILVGQEQKTLMETGLFKSGSIYLQSISSMIPPLILDPQSGESILDIAAAPGSKTTQIAALMSNTGTIVANDKSHIRLLKLKSNLNLLGVTNVKMLQMAGQILWKSYYEFFDRSLVDVPCSMEGRFRCDKPKTYADWSLKKIKAMVQVQRFLLRSAVSATKRGGIIVYSTCTFAPEENEGIIDWIITKEKGGVLVEKIDLNLLNTSPGLTSWNGHNFDDQVKNTMRIIPSDIMEGFFIAKLRKIEAK